MGSVECVTDQVPSSHSKGGLWKFVDDESTGLYFFGERSEMEECAGVRGTFTVGEPGARLDVARASAMVICKVLDHIVSMGYFEIDHV